MQTDVTVIFEGVAYGASLKDGIVTIYWQAADGAFIWAGDGLWRNERVVGCPADLPAGAYESIAGAFVKELRNARLLEVAATI